MVAAHGGLRRQNVDNLPPVAATGCCLLAAPKLEGPLDSSGANWRQAQPKVLVVVGTRPEVIKLGPVIKELELDPDIKVSLCVVAQQSDLLDQAIAEWNLVADYRVSIPTQDRRLATTLAAMLPGLADAIDAEKPTLVMVEGDTTTKSGCRFGCVLRGRTGRPRRGRLAVGRPAAALSRRNAPGARRSPVITALRTD